MLDHKDGTFTGAAGGDIYWQRWSSPGGSGGQGVVVISHGVCEYGGRYEHVAARLATEGFVTYIADHAGHGRSGRGANVNRMVEVVADLDRMIRLAAEWHPGLPVFLLGHSMGGLIALDYATGSPAELRGLVLSGPALDVSATPVQRVMAKVMSVLLPSHVLPGIKGSVVTRHPEVAAAYDSDPMIDGGRMCVRTAAEIFTTADRVRARLSRLTLPTLVMHGTADLIVKPSSSQLVAERASSTDLTLKLYDGLYHEVFNEPERDMVLDDLVGWLVKHR